MVDVCYGVKKSIAGADVEVVSYNLLANHKYLVIGHTGVNISFDRNIMSCSLVVTRGESSSKSVRHSVSRTTMANGGGADAGIYVECITDCVVLLRGYGYHDGEYNYDGHIIVIEL